MGGGGRVELLGLEFYYEFLLLFFGSNIFFFKLN